MSTGSPCLTRRRHHTRRGCTQHQKAQQPTMNAPLSKPACLTVSWSSGSASLSESSDIDTSIAQRGALGQLCDGVDEQRRRASAARRAPFAVGRRSLRGSNARTISRPASGVSQRVVCGGALTLPAQINALRWQGWRRRRCAQAKHQRARIGRGPRHHTRGVLPCGDAPARRGLPDAWAAAQRLAAGLEDEVVLGHTARRGAWVGCIAQCVTTHNG